MSTMTLSPERADLIPWARAIDQVSRDDWQPVLGRLQDAFPGYSIRRLTRSWLASDMNPNTSTEPTIVADSVEELVRQLLAPAPRCGRAFNTLRRT